jgi:hypothetical protein
MTEPFHFSHSIDRAVLFPFTRDDLSGAGFPVEEDAELDSSFAWQEPIDAVMELDLLALDWSAVVGGDARGSAILRSVANLATSFADWLSSVGSPDG